MYEEQNPKQPFSFGFIVDQSDIFVVNVVLNKRGYTFLDNNMELKRVKEELASQKTTFLLMLKPVRNGKITDKFLDSTKAAVGMDGDQLSLSMLIFILIFLHGVGGVRTDDQRVKEVSLSNDRVIRTDAWFCNFTMMVLPVILRLGLLHILVNALI